jgi:hypothetical protein
MKHTPGPWTKLPESLNIHARGCVVAEVIPQSNGIDEANARLIAAAPELLEAAREAKQTAYCYEQSLLAHGNTRAAKIYTEQYERLKVLIAKAE